MSTLTVESCTLCGEGTPHAKGMCKACYNRENWRAKNPGAPRLVPYRHKPSPRLEEINHQHNLRALDSFISRRRARGISPEGTSCMPLSLPSSSDSDSGPTFHGATRKWQIKRLPMFTERAWFAFRTGHHVLWGDSQLELMNRIQKHMGCDCD